MQAKKNPLISIQKEKPLFTLIGFICSFIIAFISFSFTVFEKPYEEPAIDIDHDSSLIILPFTIEEEPSTKAKPLATTLEPNPFVPDPDPEGPTDPDTKTTEPTKGDGISFTDSVFAATNVEPIIEEPFEFDLLEIKPQFPGGIDALNNFLEANLKYPEGAMMYNIQGIVYVLFVIEKDGTVSNVKIKGAKLGYDLDEEALRVIKLLPKFIPGSARKKPVRTQCMIPIEFEID